MEFETNNVRNVYEKIADTFNGTRRYTWRWVMDFVESLPQASIIYDIGSGNGRNMQSKNHNFIGLDNCSKFTEICSNNSFNITKADMCNLPFRSNSADGIICIASFHHLYTRERRLEALQQMYRVIKSNGKILLSIWSIVQPKKTRRQFDKHGDTIVKWDNRDGEKYDRYYYIFDLKEILELFQEAKLEMISNTWECGNEVFILKKI